MMNDNDKIRDLPLGFRLLFYLGLAIVALVFAMVALMASTPGADCVGVNYVDCMERPDR